MAEASQILASDETIKVMEILKRYSSDKDNLIPILQEIQKNVGYLSPDFVRLVSKHLKISASSVYGVATFYTMFKFAKPAKHNIKVCLGTSCHVKGGDRILETFERLLEVRCGESSRDLMFSLERVACLGSCALAPVVVIDDTIYGNMHVDRIKPILSKIRG
ncbi:MAG: NAD(P)H-dependent oxidoreductase subunit E [Nitrososphaerales archaeon]